MKIEIHNDGKNKYQSWEAKAVLNSDIQAGYHMVTLQAYGATEAEARQNLLNVVSELCNTLAALQNRI